MHLGQAKLTFAMARHAAVDLAQVVNARYDPSAAERMTETELNAVRDALAATKDFPGASGKITIDENRNARKPILILELRGGDTHMVDSITPK